VPCCAHECIQLTVCNPNNFQTSTVKARKEFESNAFSERRYVGQHSGSDEQTQGDSRSSDGPSNKSHSLCILARAAHFCFRAINETNVAGATKWTEGAHGTLDHVGVATLAVGVPPLEGRSIPTRGGVRALASVSRATIDEGGILVLFSVDPEVFSWDRRVHQPVAGRLFWA
jgi:hypothetical protein